MGYAKLLTEKFLAGLGITKQHVVGASGLGVCTVYATLACNTAQTVAQLLASPPNTGTVPCGPVVHSLGQQPQAVHVYQRAVGAAVTGLAAQVNFQFVTMDNSAVYIFAKTWTGTVPAGVAAVIDVIP